MKKTFGVFLALLVSAACTDASRVTAPTELAEPDDPANPGGIDQDGATTLATDAPACAAVTDGLVAWWRGEQSAEDALGAHNGEPADPISYEAGMVGDAFSFDGSHGFFVPDDPGLDMTEAFTIDLWFSTPYANRQMVLLDKRSSDVANFGVSVQPIWLGLGMYYNDPTAFGGDDYDRYRSPFEAIRLLPVPEASVFHHFAGTYEQVDDDAIALLMYVDGELVRADTLPGSFAATAGDGPLGIGTVDLDPGFGNFNFVGLLDEVSLYNRVLEAGEVRAIFDAGELGKCFGPEPETEPTVSIDIKPGDAENAVNCGNANAMLPVAILTTDEFDALTVDHETVRLGDAAEWHRDKKTDAARRHEEDVDGDGDVDLVFHFRFGETGLACGATEATLTGTTVEGWSFSATDGLNTHGS